MLRQLCLEAPDTLHLVMVRGVEGMAIFHHGPHVDFATRPATPQAVRRHRMLRPPLGAVLEGRRPCGREREGAEVGPSGEMSHMLVRFSDLTDIRPKRIYGSC